MVSYAAAQTRNVISIKNVRNVTLVTVRVDNIVIPDILLDTGFHYDGLMIYNPDYADSLDLANAIEVQVGGAGSGEASRALMLDSAEFYLGDIRMMNQRIIMLESDIYRGFPSNGITGYSIFGHYITEFNYDNNTMILYKTNQFKADDSWTEIPLYFKDNNIPWLDIAVVIDREEPTQISVYIDYASGDAIELLEKSNMKYDLPEETDEVFLGRGLSGDIYGKAGTISKLIIGPYELRNIRASIVPAETRSKQDNADAILGNGSLRKFNLIFDYGNRKLYLKPNSFFDESFE